MNTMPQALKTFVLLFVVLIMAIIGFNSGSNLMLFGMVGLPIAMGMLGRPDIVLILVMALFYTSLKLPILPPSVDLTRLLTLFYVITIFASIIVSKNRMPDNSVARRLVILYAIVILVTMSVRGFGLRLFGSGQWGGGQVMAQFAYIGLFLVRNHINLSARQWVTAFVLMSVASAVPLLADMLFIVSGGAIYQQFYFLSYTSGSLITGLFADTLGISWRLQRAIFVVPNLMQIAFFLRGIRWIRQAGFWLLIAMTVLLVGISGHRVSTLYFVTLGYIYMVLRRPGRFLRITASALIGVASLFLILSLSAAYLPNSFQRALAFLPNVRASEMVQRDASGTSQWRLQVWRVALLELPKYFWIGKGLTIPQKEIAQFQAIQNYNIVTGRRTDTIHEAILMREYHNGPLALLLDLGIGGFLSAFGIMIALSVEGIRTIRCREWNDPRLKLLYTILIAYLMTELVIFVFVYGDVRTIMRFLFLGSIAQGMQMTDTRLTIAKPRAGNVDPSSLSAVSLLRRQNGV